MKNVKQGSLIDYFARYTKTSRDSVETISIDMYTPYLEVIRTRFPHAKIVMDRFHIVQLLNNTINMVHVKEMNKLHQRQPRDYRKIKKSVEVIIEKF